MIKLRDQVPSIYTDASRDFQYLGWLINVVLNSVKHNVDDIYNLPNVKADPALTELLALTLGFNVKRNYNQAQLATLVSIIPSLLKYKGTKTAIDIAGNALVKASGTYGSFNCKYNDTNIEVVLPKDLVDVTLFIDLLPYILPAGFTCKIARKNQDDEKLEKIELLVGDKLKAHWFEDTDREGDIDPKTKGLASLHNSCDLGNNPNFSNFSVYDEENEIFVANTGLLSNSVIPTLGASEFSYDEPDYVAEANEYVETAKYSEKYEDDNTTIIIGE